MEFNQSNSQPTAVPKTVHVMVDIETLGITPGCKILSIGACTFLSNLDSKRLFYAGVSIADQDQYGLTVSQDTLDWWAEKDTQLATATMSSLTPLHVALLEFSNWLSSVCADKNNLFIWAKSPNFDCEILKHVYSKCCLDLPWNFRNELDVRTITKVAEVANFPFQGTAHNAIDDAIHQANWVETCYIKLGKLIS